MGKYRSRSHVMSGYAEYVSDSLQIGHPATCRSCPLTVCWRSIGLCHGAGGRGRRRDRDRWLVASQTVQTAHWADTTSSTYPTHCAILCQILHRNNLDQTKQTKKMEKKNLYLSHVSSKEHSSCGPLVVSNRNEQNK